MITALVYSAPDCELAFVIENALVCASGSDDSSWLEDFNPAKDYYGKHGEFDRNDEGYRESEDMRIFHNSFRDVDLTDHYDWNDVFEAETDDYLDD